MNLSDFFIAIEDEVALTFFLENGVTLRHEAQAMLVEVRGPQPDETPKPDEAPTPTADAIKPAPAPVAVTVGAAKPPSPSDG